MAIVQALLAAVLRSTGRLLNTVFGWATVMIFGKVPEDRQIYLSVIALASVAWIAVVAGIAFPAAGTFLLSFVPLPEGVDRTWIRLGMLAAAIVIPAAVGGVSLLLQDPKDRPVGGARVKAVLKGYPFTLGLALTLILMTVFAPIMKLRTLLRRWTSQHVPMLVEADDYEAVVTRVQEALARAGWKTERQPASWMLRAPTRILTTLAGGSIENLVAERLTTLRAPTLEVILHPADLVVSGKDADVTHARATLAEELTFSPAHLTWTAEANQLEDRLRALGREVRLGGVRAARALRRLDDVERELRRVEVSFEEWEVLFRGLLLVRVTALSGSGAARPPVEGWAQRALAPIAVALVSQALAGPRVRATLDRLIARVVGGKEEARVAEPEVPRRRAA
jgi:hypothetical protein